MRPRDWAPPSTPDVSLKVAEAAHDDIGQMEEGNNRGAFVDGCNRLTGSPLGSPWCAGAVSKWFGAAGAKRPMRDGGSCDQWVKWARAEGLWRAPSPQFVPPIGSAVVYTNGKRLVGGPYAGQLDAVHIGVVARNAPMLMSIEGNTSLSGQAVSRDGIAVALKGIDTTRVYGYVLAVTA